MYKVGKFEKVSLSEFMKSMKEEFYTWFNDEEIVEIYNNIKLPKRGTVDSAGYDFFAPFEFMIVPNDVIKIPTGIRVMINDGWFLSCYPRSSLGFKYCETLANTVGIIDSGYYNSDNEGHIMAKIVNRSSKSLNMKVEAGQGFIQGIFLPFGITIDDEADGIRNGGFGSTDK